MSAERVLVVDDNLDYLNLMASHLTRRGYVVETADDGLSALTLLTSGHAFAVLVTDLMMPGMDGIELLRRARELDPSLEVVVISGAGTLESAISSMRQNGALDYLPKPLERISDLSLAVERAAAYRRLRLEREELHAQVLAERERLRSVIAYAGDAILAADSEGQVTAANPAAGRLLGVQDLVGQDAWTRLPPPLAVLLAHWQAFEAQRPTVTEVPWPAGSVQMASLTAIPRGDAAGEGGWVMVLRDITHLKRLDQLTMNLLTEAAGRIRGPLAQAFATVVDLNEIPEARSEAQSDRIDRLMTQLGSIRRWTDDLLMLVQIESGTALRPVAVDLPRLVREWEGSASADQVRASGIAADLRLEEGVPAVYADRDLMRRLLEQLIAQAAWRSGSRGKLEVIVRYDQGTVWMEITDDGDPIEEADLPHLFEKVFAESSTRFGPTGLELAMAKTIVDKSGGQMWVRRNWPRGCTFAVSFPPMG